MESKMCLRLGMLLVAVLCNTGVSAQNGSLTIDISHNCPDVLYRIDTFSKVWTTTERNKKHGSKAWWRHYKGACRMSFMTDVEDHVLCINIFNIEITNKDVVLKFFSSPYRPERMYTKKHYRPGKWCTEEKILTMALVTEGIPSDRDMGIDITFEVTNKSRHDIEMTYFMDSAEQCDITHTISDKGSIMLETHRFPEVDTLPATCEVTVTTDDLDEYTRVCVSFVYFNLSQECSQQLTITQLDNNYYNINNMTYDCNTDAANITEVCSVDKTLTFILTRRKQNGGFFGIQITSKWTPFWESIESTKSELRGLAAARGFTVFIATIDTLIALAAAFISMSTRFPIGPLRWVAEMFGQDPDTTQYGPGCLDPPTVVGVKPEPPHFDIPPVLTARDEPI